LAQWLPRSGKPAPRKLSGGPRRKYFFVRLGIYTAIVVGLVLFRAIPELRSRMPAAFPAADPSLQVAGKSLAPELIGRLIEEYRNDYPEVHVEAREGGTTKALEDLVNREVDAAFLSRLPNEKESAAIREVRDSVMTFPIALGGIAVLAAPSSEVDSLSLDDLRAAARGEGPWTKLYAPDPNRGLWDALTAQLEVAADPPPQLQWVPAEQDVVAAVAEDPGALGFASTLALSRDLSPDVARPVGIRKGAGQPAFTANPQEVATGDYPLFHYLYVSCRPGSSALASGFVTYLYSGRGQRLVSRSGYLPARDVPRLIQLDNKPIGAKGT
jgi:phosphate transport system substrate-binding protein